MVEEGMDSANETKQYFYENIEPFIPKLTNLIERVEEVEYQNEMFNLNLNTGDIDFSDQEVIDRIKQRRKDTVADKAAIMLKHKGYKYSNIDGIHTFEQDDLVWRITNNDLRKMYRVKDGDYDELARMIEASFNRAYKREYRLLKKQLEKLN